ncbi:MAG: hypothetical protein LBO81_01215, partial [Clostridiales Family XIII bacterium]|nr:hypothetical protein [Clostridiales Family XIII bacterium]
TDGNPAADALVTADAAELAAIQSAAQPGAYPLTFAYDDPIGGAVQVTIRVMLYDNGPEPFVPGEPALWANDFGYGLDEGKLTAHIAKILSRVTGADARNNAISVAGITVDTGQLSAINDAIKAGAVGAGFPLTFTHDFGADTASVTVAVTLYGRGGPKPPQADKERIVANDFFYGCDEANLTANIAKALSGVKAFDVDGRKLAPAKLSADAAELAALTAAQAEKKLGAYPLTFSAPKGATLTVTVTLTDRGAGGVDPSPDNPRLLSGHITGNDFGYGCNQSGLTAALARTLGAVRGVSKDGKPIAGTLILPDAAQLAKIVAAQKAGKIGAYPLTFKGPDDTAITLAVTLYEGSSPGPDPVKPEEGKSIVMGNNFAYNTADPAITADVVKERSKASAADRYGFPVGRAKITVNASDLMALVLAQRAGNPGRYAVGLCLSDGTEFKITVTLVKDTPPAVPAPATKPPAFETASTGAGASERVVTRVVAVTSRIAEEFNESVQAAEERLAETFNDIVESATPLTAKTDGGAWALVNLLFAVAGVCLLFGVFLFAPGKARGDGNRRTGKREMLWMGLSFLAAFAGVAVFLLTQDLSAPMSVTDGNTLLQACIFVLCLAGVVGNLFGRLGKAGAEGNKQ